MTGIVHELFENVILNINTQIVEHYFELSPCYFTITVSVAELECRT